MSIILKGIDLPSENNSIIVEIFPSGECSTMEIEKGECYEFCLNGNTEAIQIPKGHGDIKDEAEIIKRLEEKEKEPKYQHDMDDWWVGIIDAETEVNRAPTILESEGTNEHHIERN